MLPAVGVELGVELGLDRVHQLQSGHLLFAVGIEPGRDQPEGYDQRVVTADGYASLIAKASAFEATQSERVPCPGTITGTFRPAVGYHVKLCYTEMVSRANVTLSIDEDLLREARILAAQEGTSVSRLLADRLEELIRRHKSYDTAKRRALARLRKGYRLGWSPPPSRDALHER